MKDTIFGIIFGLVIVGVPFYLLYRLRKYFHKITDKNRAAQGLQVKKRSSFGAVILRGVFFSWLFGKQDD